MISFLKKNTFKFEFTSKKSYIFIIVAEIDKNMREWDDSVDPNVPPQSHYVNLRVKDNYIVGKKGSDLYLTSSQFFFSSVGIKMN